MISTLVRRWKFRKLIGDWSRFRELVLRMMDGEDVGYEGEARFLSLKAEIASQLFLVIGPRGSALQYECNRQATMMTELLNRYQTLLSDPPPIPNERADFERAWHEHFIFLNKLKRIPKASEGAPARARPAGVPAGKPIHRRYRRRATFGVLGALLRVGVVVTVIYLLAKAVGLRLEAGRVVVTPPTTPAGVGQNVLDGLQTIWYVTTHFLDPVVLVYGQTAAVALVGCLLLGLGYLVFVRN